MNNKIVKWLSISLLFSVSLFCYLYLSKIEKQDIVKNPASAESTTQNEDIKPQKPPIFYNTLPRDCINEHGYIIQNIGGTQDETLIDSYKIKDNYYIFFNTTSNGYDIHSEVSSGCVAVIDNNLSLIKTFALSNTQNKIVEVKLIENYFVIATCEQNQTTLYKLNFDLVICEKLCLDYSKNIKLYYQDNNIFLMLSNDDTLCLKQISKAFNVLSTSIYNIKNSKVKDIYPSTNGFDIFLNGNNSYSLLKYKISSGFLSSSEIHNYILTAVLPYNNGYIGLRKNSNFELFLMDNNFAIKNYKTIDNCDFCNLFLKEKSICLYSTQKNTASLSYYCEHLDNILTLSAPYYQGFCYQNYATNKFIAYNNDNIFITQFDATTIATIDSYLGSNQNCKILYDDIIILSSNYKSGIYKNNFGSFDIFLIKNTNK